MAPFLLLATVNLSLGYLLAKRTFERFDEIEAREGDFQRYAEALKIMAARPGSADELNHRDRPAHAWMALLHHRVGPAEVRHSSHLHMILQSFFLSYFHALLLVEDSLADGVSFFMAELQRIQKVVAAADRAHGEGRVLLYLLDEVLRGTNSFERQVAVRRVVLHLLRHGAIGAVSTHDLQLTEVPELQGSVVPVHFRETVHPGGDPPMTFDYEMRPGVATTVNALKLMELVGLPAES